MKQTRCPRGQQLWNEAHDYRKPASYRAAAWVEIWDHQRTCRECADGKAAAYEAAAAAPVIPFDLQEAK